MSGAHRSLFPRIVECLKEREGEDILVIGGGVIPAVDIPFLKEQGIAEIFTPGTTTSAVIDYIKSALNERGVATHEEQN